MKVYNDTLRTDTQKHLFTPLFPLFYPLISFGVCLHCAFPRELRSFPLYRGMSEEADA